MGLILSARRAGSTQASRPVPSITADVMPIQAANDTTSSAGHGCRAAVVRADPTVEADRRSAVRQRRCVVGRRGAQAWGGTQAGDHAPPYVAAGPGGPGRTDGARRPESPLRWTCLSTRTLAVALEALGYSVSHTVVAELLHGLGYSLQGNVKTREGRQHPDRDAQFRYIARQVRAAIDGASRRSRWIPRRRNWSGPSRTAGGPGVRPRRPSAYACTTSSFRARRGARPFPYGV
jgi:hypothetical protein